MAYTKATNKAVQKYSLKAYDNLTIRVYKGQKELIKDKAISNGESVNAYINRLIAEDIGEGFKIQKQDN